MILLASHFKTFHSLDWTLKELSPHDAGNTLNQTWQEHVAAQLITERPSLIL